MAGLPAQVALLQNPALTMAVGMVPGKVRAEPATKHRAWSRALGGPAKGSESIIWEARGDPAQWGAVRWVLGAPTPRPQSTECKVHRGQTPSMGRRHENQVRAVPPLPLRPQTHHECHQPALRTVKRGNGPGGRLEGLRWLLPQKAGCVCGGGAAADPSPAHRELHAHWDGGPHMEPGPEPSRGGTCLSGQRSICPTLPVWPSPREVTTGVVVSERVGTFQAAQHST